MRTDATTKEYVTRREAEGKKRTEIIRCLKRHITREIYRLITNPPPTPNCPELRHRRQHQGITVTPGRPITDFDKYRSIMTHHTDHSAQDPRNREAS